MATLAELCKKYRAAISELGAEHYSGSDSAAAYELEARARYATLRGRADEAKGLLAAAAAYRDFERECLQVLGRAVNSGEYERGDVAYLLLYQHGIATDTSSERDMHLELFESYLDLLLRDEALDVTEESLMRASLIGQYSLGTRRPWRARRHAERLAVLLVILEGKAMARPKASHALVLAGFYAEVSDLRRAASLALVAADTYARWGYEKDAADALYTALRYEAALPPSMRKISESEVRVRLGERAAEVLAAASRPALRRDEVEHTAEFIGSYDEVMEAVMDRAEAEGYTLPQSIWRIQREELARRGITWRDPGIMNPGVKFD